MRPQSRRILLVTNIKKKAMQCGSVRLQCDSATFLGGARIAKPVAVQFSFESQVKSSEAICVSAGALWHCHSKHASEAQTAQDVLFTAIIEGSIAVSRHHPNADGTSCITPRFALTRHVTLECAMACHHLGHRERAMACHLHSRRKTVLGAHCACDRSANHRYHSTIVVTTGPSRFLALKQVPCKAAQADL